MMSIGLLKSLVLLLAIGWSSGECPPSAASSHYCQCVDSELRLVCRTINNTEFKPVFANISKSIKVKHFEILELVDLRATEIPANATGDLTFGQIYFKTNLFLTKIHSDAFIRTARRVRHLTMDMWNIKLANNPSPHDLFELINSLPNVTTVILGLPKLTDIPKGAFTSLSQLSIIRFQESDSRMYLNRRLSIGKDAFLRLEKLQHLDLSGQRINYIGSNSLKLQSNGGNFRFLLTLKGNNLNSTSFASKSLEQLNRPTYINLFNNQLDHLPKHVFEPFLSQNRTNVINVMYNPLNCSDCRNAWLSKLKQEGNEKQVVNAYCDGNPDADKLLDKKFDNCKNK